MEWVSCYAGASQSRTEATDLLRLESKLVGEEQGLWMVTKSRSSVQIEAQLSMPVLTSLLHWRMPFHQTERPWVGLKCVQRGRLRVLEPWLLASVVSVGYSKSIRVFTE